VIEASGEVLSRVEGGVGFVTLNRPKAINSLNQSMVDELRAVLAGWEQDTAVRAGCSRAPGSAACARAPWRR
jgi:enoyl-CoA hydratase